MTFHATDLTKFQCVNVIARHVVDHAIFHDDHVTLRDRHVMQHREHFLVVVPSGYRELLQEDYACESIYLQSAMAALLVVYDAANNEKLVYEDRHVVTRAFVDFCC